MELRLIELITACQEYLVQEAINEVMHFYEHGEYEMALEGVLIEMIQKKKFPKKITMEAINDLVIFYRLNVESVFDYCFWDKYQKWFSGII